MLEAIQSEGRARVIVRLRTPRPVLAESGLSQDAIQRQRAEIASVRKRVKDELQSVWHRIRHEFESIPYVALELDAAGLAKLEAAGVDVASIREDRLMAPFLSESIPQIEADLAHQVGLDGSGSVIAVIDSGIDRNHPFLAGKVIEEACYATSESGSGGDCPNGQATQVGAGAGEPCSFAPSTCRHGTHVAGIAAGSGAGLTGVAPGAQLMSIQVFHASFQCFFFEELPCARAFESDIVAGLDHVYQLRHQYQIAAVNMSLGGQSFTAACDSEFPAFAAAIDNLKAAGIATVAASGNDGFETGIASPSCISSAVSVGAIDPDNGVTFFSNVSHDLDLFAPGSSITSSVTGGGFDTFDGTSMAAPHVAGAWAVMQQADPGATVDAYLDQLQTTGRPITDLRIGNTGDTVTRSGVRLGGVAGIESPLPVLSALSPPSIGAGGRQDLDVTGSDFVPSSVVLVEGVAMPTTFISATQLAATVIAGAPDENTQSLEVTVFSPPLGGGTSNPIALEIVPPELTVSATSVDWGEPVTVNLVGGPGNRDDWIALAAVGDPNTTYIEYIYVPEWNSTATWTVNMPETAGDYEFRLFSNNGYTLLAVSPTVTVTSTAPPPPPPTLGVSATDVEVGEAVTVTLADGPGNNYDWIALAEVGDPNTSYLQIVYVPQGSATTSWTVNMPAEAGTYEFRLFEDNGYTRLATSPAVTVTAVEPEPVDPALAVSATEVDIGASVTVTLSGGPGNSLDWIALAAVGDPDSTYLQYIYVPAGSTTATWTVNMPQAAGEYEFRLFENNGYTRLATSPTVTVAAVEPEPTTAVLGVSATDVAAGDAVTVTLTGGPGNNLDWISLAAVGDPNSSYVQYVYVAPGSTTATWTVNMPQAAGQYEFRLLENNGYTLLATSPTVTVSPAEPEPTEAVLSVSATTVNSGESVTVTLTGGPGNSLDWIALAATGDPDTAYIQYVPVASGATTATWTVNMPASAGTYEFRLFENNGYNRLATSPTVTVVEPDPEPEPEPPSATLEVSAISVGGGDSVTVTLSGGPGNDFDWIGLAAVGAADTSYLQSVYVAAGATTATWTVSMPGTPGEYEFRLFANGGYTRLATSATVTVEVPPPPSLVVSATTVAGGEAVTVTLTDGPGNASDWIALAAVGSADTSYLQYSYVPWGATTTSWTVNMPAAAGDYEFRLLEDNGYNRLATSPTVTVGP